MVLWPQSARFLHGEENFTAMPWRLFFIRRGRIARPGAVNFFCIFAFLRFLRKHECVPIIYIIINK